MTDSHHRKFDPANLARLDRPERLAEIRPVELLRMAGIEVGQTVVDVGCGTGVFTLPAADIVGLDGVVYALDISDEMLAHLRGRPLPTVVTVLRSSETALPLPSTIADLIVLGSVLHEADDRRGFVTEVARLLKPGGRVVCLEWKCVPADVGPPIEARVSSAETKGLFAENGLHIQSTGSWSSARYVVVAARALVPNRGES